MHPAPRAATFRRVLPYSEHKQSPDIAPEFSNHHFTSLCSLHNGHGTTSPATQRGHPSGRAGILMYLMATSRWHRLPRWRRGQTARGCLARARHINRSCDDRLRCLRSCSFSWRLAMAVRLSTGSEWFAGRVLDEAESIRPSSATGMSLSFRQ